MINKCFTAPSKGRKYANTDTEWKIRSDERLDEYFFANYFGKVLALNLAFNHPKTTYLMEKNRTNRQV